MIKLVQGEEIRHWYNERNHSNIVTDGGLHWSSMKYEHMQPYFDLYTKNSNIHLLVATREDNDGVERLLGRALVWQDEHGNFFMDNIYADEYTRYDMLQHAFERGWRWLPFVHETIHVILDEVAFDTYPYVDTMQFMMLDGYTWFLSNNPEPKYGAVYQFSSHKGYIFLWTPPQKALELELV